jgi:kinesin family protein 6/9
MGPWNALLHSLGKFNIMVKSAVKVVVRTKPTAAFATRNLIIDSETKSIEVHVSKDAAAGLINNQLEDWKFRFDDIMHNSS